MLYGSSPATWRSLTNSTSVLTACGRRQRRRNSLTYVLDLLAFAVETGRLTEACGEAVKSIALKSSNVETTTPPAALTTTEERPFMERPQTDTKAVTVIDEDKVLREVRYRKMYNQDGVDGVACGLTPFDVATHDVTTRRTFPTSRFHREFPPLLADTLSSEATGEVFSNAWCGCRDTLTLLLARLEQLKGTPTDEISSEISAKTKLVQRQLLEAGKGEVYKRLVRALDQRVPPDQRLLKNESRRPHVVLKQGCKSTLPSCWAKRKPIAGSQLFLQPSKLSDYVRTDD